MSAKAVIGHRLLGRKVVIAPYVEVVLIFVRRSLVACARLIPSPSAFRPNHSASKAGSGSSVYRSTSLLAFSLWQYLRASAAVP